MKIIAVHLGDNLMQTDISKLISFVSETRKKQIKRFIREKDQCSSLIGELMVRRYLEIKLRMDSKNLTFNYNKYGKPFLKHINNFQFNISHSGDWVVCAFDKKPIGVDIERVTSVDLCIAKKFFSKKEYYQLLQKNPKEKLSSFFKYWTAKESYIKAIGKGLSMPLNSFYAAIHKEKIVFHSFENNDKWFGKIFNIDLAYKLSICSRTNLFPEQVSILQDKEIYKYFTIKE
ncbi:4'-phosphopantetheinyl transferase superfamily protein [Sporolactobacillus shoreicorticis]|uniref:4'-phosphopantetheinyl transferase family protein n=1 Tax=Sporolactobacillus shoreicorticis TaxID=1923877 RepID=A0ABW5S112_9BACL|nr:4'-phosphopantetheinyl transferase superfamily protein [Sporolactobacillus shoreicorticis]MCO7127522.1 4'-phosphopantetheinyl transferase superfamily protein [Sporolactobacillus shoreicorticis]